MQLNRLAFHQYGLKSLDAQSVQRRRAVEHYRMLLNNILQHIPNLHLKPLHHLLGVLNVVGSSVGHQLFHNKRLKQLNRHLLRKTALINLKLRTYYDNGTSGIIYTLAQKILTETALFSFQHIGQGFQGAVARSRNRTPSPSVVYKGIHSLLKHALLIADDNIRRAKLQKPCQTVVPVYDPSVQVI